MHILLTGATGYTGRGIAATLAATHTVRGLDIRPGETPIPDMIVGDLCDLDTCRQAVRGCDAIVMCHMAPNPDGYKTPPLAIDVNVKGTANLYHAALETDIRRVVLISSLGLLPPARRNIVPGDGPYEFGSGLYATTKIMQECLARFYFEKCGISTVALRPQWIVYDGEVTTKYGKRLERYDTTLVDPRDIGTAAVQSLALTDPGIRAFNLGQDDATFDLEATHQVLNWHPLYRFEILPRN